MNAAPQTEQQQQQQQQQQAERQCAPQHAIDRCQRCMGQQTDINTAGIIILCAMTLFPLAFAAVGLAEHDYFVDYTVQATCVGLIPCAVVLCVTLVCSVWLRCGCRPDRVCHWPEFMDVHYVRDRTFCFVQWFTLSHIAAVTLACSRASSGVYLTATLFWCAGLAFIVIHANIYKGRIRPWRVFIAFEAVAHEPDELKRGRYISYFHVVYRDVFGVSYFGDIEHELATSRMQETA